MHNTIHVTAALSRFGGTRRFASMTLNKEAKKVCFGNRRCNNIRKISSTTDMWKKMTDRTRSLTMALEDSCDVSDSDPKQKFRQRKALSQAITLVESVAPVQRRQANLLLEHLLKHRQEKGPAKKSFRLGIAGPPGAGKSTFVEAFGQYLLRVRQVPSSVQGSDSEGSSIYFPKKIAVVCIDPSSAVTGGSILGDKTRMTELSRHERAYVRPSPTRGTLGGLSAYTDDVVSILEVSGYDLIIVETVGLGQSEIEVQQSVDMMLLMVPPGGGDELQGVKKGIVEVADMIVVTKADGKFLAPAKNTAADYRGAMRFFVHRRKGKEASALWDAPPVLLASSHTGDGLSKVWDEICRFRSIVVKTKEFESKRHQQSRYWMWKHVQNLILEKAHGDRDLRHRSKSLELALDQGTSTPRVAASELLDSLFTTGNSEA